MPSSSDEMREKMRERFGNLEPSGPEEELANHGYILLKGWNWFHPTIKRYREMTQNDYDCMKFLVEEWDYAGLSSEE
jgi:hypothetical protein